MSLATDDYSHSRNPQRRAEADFLEFIAQDKEQRHVADPNFHAALYDEAAELVRSRLRAPAGEAAGEAAS